MGRRVSPVVSIAVFSLSVMFMVVGVVQRNGVFYFAALVLMGGSMVSLFWWIVTRPDKERRKGPIATVIEDNVSQNKCSRCHKPWVAGEEPIYQACVTCRAVFHPGACIQLHTEGTGHQAQV